MVTHPSFCWSYGCLTTVIWPFTLTAFGSSFYCELLRYVTWGLYYPFVWKKLEYSAHPSPKWLKFAQHKHGANVKVESVNGQITEAQLCSFDKITCMKYCSRQPDI